MQSQDKDFALYTLNYATKLIYSATDLKGLIEVAIDMFLELAEANCGSIILLDSQDSSLKIAVVKRQYSTIYNYPEKRLEPAPKLILEVINETKPYFTNNPAQFQNIGDDSGKDANSLLCIPLLGQEKAIGVVCLYSQCNEYDQDTINLISTLATQVGVNIENVRLYKELEEWAKVLELRVAERTKELAEANEELRKIDQAKSDFLSTAAHELKTPMTSIKAIALTLVNNPDEDIAIRTEFLSLISSEVDRLTRLINDILNLSKIEAGMLEWDMNQISLRDVINQSITNINPVACQKKIKIQMNIPEGLPNITGDYERLMQVVINLLSNAIKFTPEGGEIEVRIKYRHQPEEILQVSVTDSGVGIAREDLEKVFDKFKQVGGKKTQGTGLGLTICKQIIEHHGGKIWVESQLGMGATFHFTIPVRNNP
ncbi:MAG: GAF domain-containing sensor histidine kinase [bacterium]